MTVPTLGRIGDLEIELHRSSRVRRLRLKVETKTGRVRLTMPLVFPEKKALAWAGGHREWIERTLAALPDPVAIGPGSTLPLFGRPHQVDWRPDLGRRIRIENDRICVGGPVESLGNRLLRWLKQVAVTTLEAETRLLAGSAGLPLTRVGVGDPRSRWGSCSSSGAIRYSWRLILAPDLVRRATVAHEVAHLRHFDHGPEFHALVEQLLGEDPGPARLWLRREGASLHRIALVA